MDKKLANEFYWNIPLEEEWRSEAVRDLTLGQTYVMVLERWGYEKSCKVLMMMKAAKLGWAGP